MRHRNCVEVVTDYRDRCLWFDGLEMAILTQVNRKRAIEFFRKLNPKRPREPRLLRKKYSTRTDEAIRKASGRAD